MESGARRIVENVEAAMIHEPPHMDFAEGVSPSMRSVEAVIREVAQSEVPVLLLAERGAGKKATARSLFARWSTCFSLAAPKTLPPAACRSHA